ncbi:peptidoglycan DD-metalloendopeptidase family protein [Collimonas sp.]|uniref:peptidoglycan DD-metalloendopeptidase family protein n=1 Tax=Collimonas sp. TaxID=1963772 RepID=UPI002C1C621A|nr:peptidoglycan DD-metalloendopeptidase family protein [Collimonas sp.]HWW99818.1 peptidoglycan DD-metalloendopeptidase family protein [Collimonas sp.]
MKKTRFIALGVMIATLAACTTPRTPAPVVERRSGGSVATTGTATAEAPRAADGHGSYTVKQGDTLYRIALEFGQSYRDIVTWNKLENANDIKVGQVLRVQPPDAGSGAAGGAQMASVATSSGVEVRSLGSAPTAAAGGSAANKSGPRGDKRPYSDAALAELQKPDAPSSSDTPKTVAPAVAAPAAAVAASTPAASAASGDEDKVDWMWPAEGKQVGAFDQGKKGIDIAGKSGQSVVAAAGGKVMYAGSGIRGYGNLVIIKHTSSLLSAYAHNKTILVKEGQTVSKGQKIAEMGNSDSDVVKLHFEIRQQGKPVDPSKFLPNR